MSRRREREIGQTLSAQQFHKADVMKGLKDWKIYAFCAGQFGADAMCVIQNSKNIPLSKPFQKHGLNDPCRLYGYSTFLPTIIKGLGKWSTAEVQALTIPCYSVGAISYLVVARLSDSQQRRGLYSVAFGLISVVGYGVLISDSSNGVRFFGCFLVAFGLYVVVGLPLAWLPTNNPRYGKRTTATGLQLTVGNTSGIMAPFRMPLSLPLSTLPPHSIPDAKGSYFLVYKSNEGPRFVRGHAVTLGLVAFASLVYALMWWVLARENRKRREGREDARVAHLTEAEIAELGDESPRFLYTI